MLVVVVAVAGGVPSGCAPGPRVRANLPATIYTHPLPGIVAGPGTARLEVSLRQRDEDYHLRALLHRPHSSRLVLSFGAVRMADGVLETAPEGVVCGRDGGRTLMGRLRASPDLSRVSLVLWEDGAPCMLASGDLILSGPGASDPSVLGVVAAAPPPGARDLQLAYHAALKLELCREEPLALVTLCAAALNWLDDSCLQRLVDGDLPHNLVDALHRIPPSMAGQAEVSLYPAGREATTPTYIIRARFPAHEPLTLRLNLCRDAAAWSISRMELIP